MHKILSILIFMIFSYNGLSTELSEDKVKSFYSKLVQSSNDKNLKELSSYLGETMTYHVIEIETNKEIFNYTKKSMIDALTQLWSNVSHYKHEMSELEIVISEDKKSAITKFKNKDSYRQSEKFFEVKHNETNHLKVNSKNQIVIVKIEARIKTKR